MAYHYTCAICSTPFTALNHTRKYCSAECTYAGKRRKQERTCEWCKSAYYATGKRNERFCSRDCWEQDHARKPKQSTCDICGQTFTQPRGYNNKTCGKECAVMAVSMATNQHVTRTCKTCGNEYRTKQSKKLLFCSRACSDKGRNASGQRAAPFHSCKYCGEQFQAKVYENHTPEYCSMNCFNEYRRSNAFVPVYYGPDWNKQRLLRLSIDGYTCKHCGAPEGKRHHDVHHLIPFKEFGPTRYMEANSLDNLITLCRFCHRKAERAIRFGIS